MISAKVYQPVGVEIGGLSVTEVDTGIVAQLRRLLAEHGVIVLPDQNVDDMGFTRFLQHFGELTFTVGETPVPGHADLNVISNLGRATPPRSVFHVDTSYVRRPPSYTALRAVAIPAAGGQTEFTNQYRAYDTLPALIKQRLKGKRIRHVVTGVEPGDEQESAAEHPVFRVHPITGRTTLYLSTPQRCVSIVGMADAEARELIEFLYAHSTRADNVFRHSWRSGDVVMWDNGCVLHRADHSGVVGERVMHRGMVTTPGTASTQP